VRSDNTYSANGFAEMIKEIVANIKVTSASSFQEGIVMRPHDLSTSTINAQKPKARKWMVWLTILNLLGIITLGCVLTKPNGIAPTVQAGNGGPVVPTVQQMKFQASDCNVAGITFPDITTSYNVDAVYDGPYLVCSSTSEGAHNLSVHYYINIVAYKADKLDALYQDLQTNIRGFVDQSNEWNADPDVPAEIKEQITFIRNDSEGYVFMITGFSNVQNCENGRGYGVEKVLGKYLVQVQFQSCELADAGAYTDVLKSLETAALAAIQRVEGAR
jgi:hypothetical protein